MDSNRLTCLGIDNTGKLVLTYGKEDTDFYVDGDPSSTYIYRAAESTFFCRVRDLFPSELQAMYIDRESAGAWSAEGLIAQWDESQNQFPEELWRLMFEREFYRTYQGISVDNSIPGAANPRFLRDMMNGKKKYQRRMFIRNQELYFATKYFGTRATSEQIMMRFSNPVDSIIKPDFTLKITPYSDMYIAYSFAANNKQNIRAKAGQQYTIKYSGDTADITLLYGASFIQEIDDLSRCFVGDNDFTKATRLQKLVLGSSDENYKNTYMTGVSIGNLPMLEYLDVRKITGLNSVINLSGCGNVREIHAEGSGATGVIFANGGKLEKAYLPAITTLTMKNLSYLNDFLIENYDNLTRLVVENTPFVNTYDLVNKAINLGAIRLTGMNWDNTYNIQDTSIFERMYLMRGVDNNNLEIPDSVLAGTASVAVMKKQALNRFNKKWKNLVFTYNSFIEQYAVTFKNTDGTILDVQYVDKGSLPVDPITRDTDPIPTPTKESSVENDFTFDKWDTTFSPVFGDIVITATYTSSIREYTVKYVSKGATLKTIRAKYGATVFYDGDIPVYTAEEQAYKYYLFNKWDKSGYVDGDKTINAVFDEMQYTSGYYNTKDLSELTPVELYALTRIKGLADELLDNGTLALKDSISFEMGHDFDFGDVETYELVKDCKYVDTGASTVFTGNNYIDTNISIMNKDRSFVLAVDYEFAAGNTSNATLMQCYRSNGKDGFKLFYNSSPKIQWGTSSKQSSNVGNREMIVLRHIAGETGLHIYLSNMTGDSIEYAELSHTRTVNINSTLVFGCVKADDGAYENKAKGTIHWAKMWYTDLGDATCRELSEYIHEKMNLEMIGTKRKWLSDVEDTRSAMTFLASHTLRTKKILSPRGTNAGGWAETSLRDWLNTRFYNGLPQFMKQLVKKVRVSSSIGDKSEEISESNNYVYIPSVIEWKHDIERNRTTEDGRTEVTNEPFNSEDAPISFITKAADRIRKDYTDIAVEHITRSPSMNYSSYFYVIDTKGNANQIGTPSSEYGVVVELNI